MIVGSSPVSIGHFVFDSWLLKITGVVKELIRIHGYVSDALPKYLVSTDTIIKLITCDFADIGKCAATVHSLAVM